MCVICPHPEGEAGDGGARVLGRARLAVGEDRDVGQEGRAGGHEQEHRRVEVQPAN